MAHLHVHPTPVKFSDREKRLRDEIVKRTILHQDIKRGGWRCITEALIGEELFRAIEDMLGIAPFASGESVEFRICGNAIYRRNGELKTDE